MARLAKYALGKPYISKVVKTETTKQKATNGRVYTWYNTNQLLGSYKGVIGIKTGSGTAAGDCLIFAARRDSHTLVGTILNSDKRYSDATKMLDWGFNDRANRPDHRPAPRTPPADNHVRGRRNSAPAPRSSRDPAAGRIRRCSAGERARMTTGSSPATMFRSQRLRPGGSTGLEAYITTAVDHRGDSTVHGFCTKSIRILFVLRRHPHRIKSGLPSEAAEDPG